MTPKPFVAALLALAFFLGACESYSPSQEDIGRDEVVPGTACPQPDGTWKAA